MTESLAETAVALSFAFAADPRFATLSERLTIASGPFGLLHWTLGIAAAVEDGLVTATEEVDDVDFLSAIDRVADYVLDRTLAPGGSSPSAEPLTNFTIWAAHQR